MKYYLDEDLSPKIADLLKKKKIDALSAHQIEMTQASDLQQLEYAGTHNRCLVTRNRNDFITLTLRFFNENRKHCGVLIIPHTLPEDNFNLIAKALAKHAATYPTGVTPYSIDFLKA